MYKVNESLMEMPFEIGRARAFTPGWLENESIWLHMEYKYLLELLKSGLYDSFLKDFRSSCIAFLNPDRYGRSLLENSSFIASSANPDHKLHGKGFVARLSGSTVEFLNIWQIMMFGVHPFTIEEKQLNLSFQPFIPEYLIADNRQVTATFLGKINVVYHMKNVSSVIPGHYSVKEYQVVYPDKTVIKQKLQGQIAFDIRNGLVEQIIVVILN
jgi:hypothetical protein